MQFCTNKLMFVTVFMNNVALQLSLGDHLCKNAYCIRNKLPVSKLSVHFRNMSRSSRGSVYCPWWSTRLRLTPKTIRWLHKSCASSITQDHETKTTLSNVQLSWTITSISQLNATLPGQNSGPMWLLNGRICSDFESTRISSDSRTFLTLPTRVKFTLFSKY